MDLLRLAGRAGRSSRPSPAPAPRGPRLFRSPWLASVPLCQGSPTLISAQLVVLVCAVEVCCCSQLTQSGGEPGFML